MKNNDAKIIASMQALAMDGINKAGGGHMGMAIGAAPITYTIFKKFLRINKEHADWINRDRFILSAGHGSMSIYTIMNFLGLLDIEDIKKHKKLHSKTPSHPEIDATKYVEATTGPLGQGIAMAVGMAISERYLQKKYNKPGMNIIDHDVIALHGDGCVQEGIALEAIQLAGTLQLENLILIHDFNDIQIDSRASEVQKTNFIQYFKSCNFDTFVVLDPTSENIEAAIKKAKKSKKPSYIQVHTLIATHTPVENTSSGHNGTLNPEKTLEFKKVLGLSNTIPFEYDQDVYDEVRSSWETKNKAYKKWNSLFNKYSKQYPELHKELLDMYNNKIQIDFSDVKFEMTDTATRNYMVPMMNKLETYPNVIGGSADLAASTKIKFSKTIDEGGKNIKYGIREHAMSAINNGIYLHSHLRTIDATFFAFADYAKAAYRMGALMEIPSVHIFTHDSYQVGEDGPTHQPFDQLPMLRAMANMKVIRPCDESEMKAAFQRAFNQNKEQYAIIACRQNIKSFNLCDLEIKPAYHIIKKDKFDVSILATGSEVELAVEVAQKLDSQGVVAQVISVPLLQELVKDDELARSLGLHKAPIYAIEASSESMWYRLSKHNRVDTQLAESFGHSEAGDIVYKLKGFDAELISEKVTEFLK